MRRHFVEAECAADARVFERGARTARTLRLGERAGSAPLQAPDHLPLAQSEDSSPARSEASLRSEKAASEYAATRDQRRSVQARIATARSLDEALHVRQVRGEEAYSNVAIARACDVDERIVRDWRDDSPDAKRALPAWALKLLPSEIHRELNADTEAARVGKIDRRELPNVRPMLSKLAAQLPLEDRDVADRELAAAERMIQAMRQRLWRGR
jgi:hypothetical protein